MQERVGKETKIDRASL